jgi:hypothetical protein
MSNLNGSQGIVKQFLRNYKLHMSCSLFKPKEKLFMLKTKEKSSCMKYIWIELRRKHFQICCLKKKIVLCTIRNFVGGVQYSKNIAKGPMNMVLSKEKP